MSHSFPSGHSPFSYTSVRRNDELGQLGEQIEGLLRPAIADLTLDDPERATDQRLLERRGTRESGRDRPAQSTDVAVDRGVVARRGGGARGGRLDQAEACLRRVGSRVLEQRT